MGWILAKNKRTMLPAPFVSTNTGCKNLFGEQALGLWRVLTNPPCPLYPGKQISPRATAPSAISGHLFFIRLLDLREPAAASGSANKSVSQTM
jgi:hypothetical protein